MTDRARKIRNGKQARAIAALEDPKRYHDGLVYLRDDEAKTLLDMFKGWQQERLMKAVPAEYEGDARSTWWYVCGECHGPINKPDLFCRHCGNRIDWEGFLPEEDER